MSFDNDAIVVNGEKWYKAKAVAVKLGYKDTKRAIPDLVSKPNKRSFRSLCATTTGLDGCFLNALYLNEDGLHELIMKSQKPKAVDVASEFNITVEKKYLRKEIEIVSFVQTFLTGLSIPFEFQKPVGPYRVDLYLPCHLLAIEIDEHGHKDRDPAYEEEREKKIQRLLKCDFLRVNPDDKDFNLAVFLSDITRYIMIMK